MGCLSVCLGTDAVSITQPSSSHQSGPIQHPPESRIKSPVPYLASVVCGGSGWLHMVDWELSYLLRITGLCVHGLHDTHPIAGDGDLALAKHSSLIISILARLFELFTQTFQSPISIIPIPILLFPCRRPLVHHWTHRLVEDMSPFRPGREACFSVLAVRTRKYSNEVTRYVKTPFTKHGGASVGTGKNGDGSMGVQLPAEHLSRIGRRPTCFGRHGESLCSCQPAFKSGGETAKYMTAVLGLVDN